MSQNRPQDNQAESKSSNIQIALDWFHSQRKWLTNQIAYYSLRIYGIELSIEAVKDGTYSNSEHDSLVFTDSDTIDLLLSTAKDCFDNANDRRRAITEKCKSLFTLNSLLLGLTGVLLPNRFQFEPMWMKLIAFFAVLALLNSIFILLTFFDVGRDTEVALTQEQVDLEPSDFKQELIDSLLFCRLAMNNRTDYLVDLYRVARFFFLGAFTVILFLFAINFFATSPSDKVKETIHQLRAEPQLIELLRGPKGAKGEKGDQGIAGVQGAKGEKGDSGPPVVLDAERLIKKILDDPMLKKNFEQLKHELREKTPTKTK